MTPFRTFARQLRIRRMHQHGGPRLLLVPLEQPAAGCGSLARTVAEVIDGGADAVVLHKGLLRHVHPESFTSASLVVNLSASTKHAPDSTHLVAHVEEAVRLGADAVCVSVDFGSDGENRQIADLATVAEECDRWNVPLLASVHPRGPEQGSPELLARAAGLAVDLGADLVELPPVADHAAQADVIAGCAIPVLVAVTHHRVDAETVAEARRALAAGSGGITAGQAVADSGDPAALARVLANVVHADAPRGIPSARSRPHGV
ncbi:2-amino-4,5-dihydroxy-6-one-heptanoic acid-7-phosphate synthase [Actinosynnema pretiosum]|nr:2-amino-4,5-dihydroxy-6-one-heptanoic acid-7-phosphate synthase [Actinosynnema pretiosum]